MMMGLTTWQARARSNPGDPGIFFPCAHPLGAPSMADSVAVRAGGPLGTLAMSLYRVLRLVWRECTENQVLRMLGLSVLYLWTQRRLGAAKDALFDLIFTQIRFHSSETMDMIRTYVSQRLMDSAVGMEVSTTDEIGRAEILHDAGEGRLVSYDLHSSGAAPIHVTHVPIASNSTWIWFPTRSRPWYTLPLVWIRPDKEVSLFWDALPSFFRRIIQESGLLTMIKQYLPSPMRRGRRDQQARERQRALVNRLVVSAFCWNRELIPQLLNDAVNFTHRCRTRSCVINRLTSSGSRPITAPPRKMETVVLGPKGRELLDDIRQFFRKREWYRANDLPYQRVYLLHGPPGNGKSSFLQALAILFRINYYYLQLASKTLNREVLRNNLKDYTLHKQCIVVLEDVESVFAKAKKESARASDGDDTGKREEMQQLALTTAMALAGAGGEGGQAGDVEAMKKAMDSGKSNFFGVKIEDFIDLISGMMNPPSGRLIFFTTNHCDRLHEEILRVVDEQGIRVEFPNANLFIMHGMWKQFYKEVKESKASWETFRANFEATFGPDDRVGFEIELQREGKSARETTAPGGVWKDGQEAKGGNQSGSRVKDEIASSTQQVEQDKSDPEETRRGGEEVKSGDKSGGDVTNAIVKRTQQKSARKRLQTVRMRLVTGVKGARLEKVAPDTSERPRRIDGSDKSVADGIPRPFQIVPGVDLEEDERGAREVISCRKPFAIAVKPSGGGQVRYLIPDGKGKLEFRTNSDGLAPGNGLFVSTRALNGSTKSNCYSIRHRETGQYLSYELREDVLSVRPARDVRDKNCASFLVTFPRRFSAAAFQEYLMRFRTSPKAAAELKNLGLVSGK